jgi:type IV pilus assembly protein PilC
MADPDPPPPTGTFAYEAQSADGRTYRGTLDAAAITAAAEQLQSLQLRVTRLEPAEPPRRRMALGEDDFLFVNRQLSHLTAGGLPMEKGLRLIAGELPRRQARAVGAIAADLEAGAPIGDAFAGRGTTFPPMYGRLLEAGVRANNLPGVLLSLGRHIEMLQRLRAAVWRAAAYPLMVALALLAVLVFIWGYIMPRLGPLTGGIAATPPGWYIWPPPATSKMPDLSLLPPVARGVSYAIMGLLAVVLALAAVVVLLGRAPVGRRMLEPVLRPLPVVGPVVRWNRVARWCDALHLGVSSGLDLPAALALAGEAVDSNDARSDTEDLVAAVQAGRGLDPAPPLRLLPPMVPAALALGIDQNDLPAAAATLARMYREQAEVRLAIVPQVLSPVLLLLIAGCVGLAVASALLPMVVLLHDLSG